MADTVVAADGSSRCRRRLSWRQASPLVVLVVAALPYVGVLDAPFVFDDIKLVAENDLLSRAWEEPAEVLSTFDITARRWDAEELRPNYRPLRFLSYMLDVGLTRLVYGDTVSGAPPPFFFHLSNVVLHALNALLVLVFARRLLRVFLADDVAAFAAFAAATLFAVHPLATEAVTYVSGRRDVLSTFFFLAACVVFVGRDARVTAMRPPAVGRLVAVPLLLVAGLLSKEMVATLPGVLLLIDWLRGARWGVRRLLLHASVWGLVLVHTAANLSGGGLVAPPAADGWWNLVLMACRYVARYLGLLLLPLRQSIDYSFDAIPVSHGALQPPTGLLAAALVLALLAGATLCLARVMRRRRERAGLPAVVALTLFWFLGTLLPVLQLVPIAERFAERFAYLPAVGVVLLVGAALGCLRRLEPIAAGGGLALVALVALAGSQERNRDWSSPLRLWTAAVEAQPRSARAHLGRANALKENGRLPESAEEYSRALAIFAEAPDVPLHHGFRLQALTLRGQVYGLLAAEKPELRARAIADYRLLLTLEDTDGVAIDGSAKHTVIHFDLAGFLLGEGDTEGAVREYRRVIEIGSPAPLVAAAHYYLGRMALASGAVEEAAAAYERALASTPAEDPARFVIVTELTKLLLETRAYDDASRVLESALAWTAGEDRLACLLRLAEITDRRGDLSGTREQLEAILAEGPGFVPALLSLAGIETNLGDLDSAERRYREVLALRPASAEARDGLRSIAIRRGAAGGDGATDPAAEALASLAVIAGKGAEHLDKGELIAARDVYEELLSKAEVAGESGDGFRLEAHRRLASVAERLGAYRVASEHLRFALAAAPESPELLRRLGDLCLRRLSDRAMARTYYERYLDAVPTADVPDPLVRVNLSQLLAKDDPKKAIEQAETARADGFESPALDRSLGHLYATVGQWQRALDAFTRYLDAAAGEDEASVEAVRAFVRQDVLPHLLEN